MSQKSSPNGVSRICGAPCAPRPALRIASTHVGLGLEHLVAQRVVERLAREPDQPQPVEVVQVGGDAIDDDGSRPRAPIMFQPGRDELRARSGALAAHVDRRLRPVEHEQAQDARLVGGELVEDPRVRRVAPPRRSTSAERRSSSAPRSRRVARAAAGAGSALRGARLAPSCAAASTTPEHAARPPAESDAVAGRARSGSPDAAARMRRPVASSEARTVQSAVRTHAVTGDARDAGPGAQQVVVGVGSSLTPKIARWTQARAEAEHRAVQVEQPLVLAHRRAQHLREVRPTASRACARRSARAPARLWRRLNSGSVERRHRVLDGLHRRPTRGSRRTRARRPRPARRRVRGPPRGRPRAAARSRSSGRVRSDARAVQQLLADVARP